MASPTQDALVDPGTTARIADIYGQLGPGGPTLQPPQFLQDAVSAMSAYGNGGQPQPPPQDTPPSGAQLGMTAQQAGAMLPNALPSWSDVGKTLGRPWAPGGPFDPNAIDPNRGVPYNAPHQTTLGGLAATDDPLYGLGALGGLTGAFGEIGPLGAGAAAKAVLGAKAAGRSALEGAPQAAGDFAASMGVRAPQAVAAGNEVPRLVAKQLEALKAGGATDAEIAEFQKTMAPPSTVLPKGSITTAEGGTADAGLLTRSLQTAAGQEGVPLSQHSLFADYAIGGVKGPKVVASHGGDIGTATRAVMSGDTDVINLLGDPLTNQLIQNKVADILRRSGLPEDVVRRGLFAEIAQGRGAAIDALSPKDIAAAAERFPPVPASIVDANVATVSDALQKPQPMQSLIDSMRTAGASETDIAGGLRAMGLSAKEAKAWLGAGPGMTKVAGTDSTDPFAGAVNRPVVTPPVALSDAERAALGENLRGINTPRGESVPMINPAITPPAALSDAERAAAVERAQAGSIPSGQLFREPYPGAVESVPPAPPGPPRSPFAPSAGPPPSLPEQERNMARTIGMGALSLFTDLGRATALVAHLPLTRQASSLLGDALLRGDLAEVPQALGRTISGVLSEGSFNAFRRGAITNLERSSGVSGVWDRLILESKGPLNSTEEFTMRSILTTRLGGAAVGGTIGGLQGNTPEEHARNALIGAGVGLSLQNVNRAYPAMLNSLRYGSAQALVDLRVASGGAGAINAAEANRIIDAVNLMSGRGKLPFEGAVKFSGGKMIPVGRHAAETLNNIFFGPRYLSSELSVVPSVVRSLGGVVMDARMRRPLDAVDVFKVRAFAGQVGMAAGILGLMSAFGWKVVTDSSSHDYGMAVAPDGSRVDPWAGPGSVARLVLNEGSFAADAYAGRKPRYGANTGIDTATAFFRGKLTPGPATAAANTLAGSLPSGEAIPNIRGAISSGDLGALAQGIPQIAYGNQAMQPIFSEAATGGPPTSPTIGGVKPTQESRFDIAKGLMALSGLSIRNTQERVNYDGLGTDGSDPGYQSGYILDQYQKLVQASGAKWHESEPTMAPPATTIGQGSNAIKLDQFTAQRWVKALGQEREITLRQLLADPKWETYGEKVKQDKWDAAVRQADKIAGSNFLANDLIQQTDPKLVVAEAVDGFIKQGASYKDKAYWVASLDRAGKLSPDVAAAINALKDTPPSGKEPITVAEYLTAAPLVHQYLSHVPYGTDAHPVGTPADWTAVEQARQYESVRRDALVRAGTPPQSAAARAKSEVSQSLGGVQRMLFLEGPLLENPVRRSMHQRDGTLLSRFLGTAPQTYQESEAAFRQFPASR